MRVSEVEGVVVLAAGSVVGRCVEGVPPGLPAGGEDVVVAERGPEDQLAEEVLIRHEELGIEVCRGPVLVDHIPRMDHDVDRGGQHAVTDRELCRQPAARVPEHEQVVRHVRIVGLEHGFRAEGNAIGEGSVGVLCPGQQATGRERADRSDTPREDRGDAVHWPDRERAEGGGIRVPDDGDRAGRHELQVRSAGEERGPARSRREQRGEHDRRRQARGPPPIVRIAID